MTTATTEQPAYTVTIEDAGPACKRVKITIPVEAVESRLAESMGVMASQTVLPGFRKGKAPRSLIERRFGPAIRLETRNQLIADAYSKAIQDHQLKPVGEPQMEKESDALELKPGQPLEFSLTVEVVPDFDLPVLEGLTIKRPVIEVADEHVNLELQRQQFRFGHAERIQGPFQAYDRILCDAEVYREGESEAFFKTDQALLVYPSPDDQGKGQVLGLLIDNLADQLSDKRVGDRITIETTGPASHEREDIRGKKLRVELTIRDAERITPASTDQLITRFGLGTEENLRGQLRVGLEQRRDAEQRSAMREQVYEHLIRSVDFPLPERLSESQITRTLQRQRVELLHQGMEAEEVEHRLAEFRAESESLARNRLKLLFVLAKAADKFGVEVSGQEINAQIAAMAARRGERPEALRDQMQKTGLINEVALQIREHKTADVILAKAHTTDVSAEEWNAAVSKQFEERRQAAAATKEKKKKKSGE
jgi:trigger factor